MSYLNHRLQININNRSQTVLEDLSYIGAINLRSLKGGDEPKLFFPKSEKQIIQYFGEPSKNYNDVQQLIDFNRDYPVWACASTEDGTGRYGGVLVTANGTEPFVGGYRNFSSVSFSAIENIEEAGTGDGSTTTFTDTLTNITEYNLESIDLIINGTLVDVSVSTAGVTETLTITGAYSGSGTLNTDTGAFSFTFDSAIPSGGKVEILYDTDRSDDVYFMLHNPNKEADDTAVLVTYANDIFTISVYNINTDGTYTEIDESPYEVSLTEGSKNGFGINNYIIDVLEDNNYLTPVINEAISVTTFTDDTTQIELSGGERGTIDLTVGYDYFKQVKKYKTNIFFDASGDSEVIALFDVLSKSFQKYSTYIFAIPLDTASNSITTVSSYSLNNDNIKLYWNYMQYSNFYTDGTFYACPIGRVAWKHGKNRENFYSGRQVSWIDENEVGGQLGSGFLKAFYAPTPTEVKNLEDANINPIVFDNNYGVIATSDYTRTTVTSDYSFGGHVGLRNYIINAVVENVLPYQVDKPNDTSHRTNVRNQVDLIMSGPANVEGLLNWYDIKCDGENNNEDIRAQRKFVIEVAVQFTPFSKTIVFTFSNYGQNVEVSEAFA